ncbi:hypothetical protein EP331_06895 [bacterium]|nr:MAG: hypothetical protein EP331_06895 [bacterium]
MKTSVKSALVLFVVSPLSALPLIVSSIGKKEFVFYISFFTAVIGLFYTYPVSSDGHTHLQHAMNDYESMSFTSFLSESFKILFFLDGAMKTDLYIHVLSFISVVVIGIPVLMHTIAGLVLGWISAKTLSLLMPRYKGKLDMSIVLVTIFILLSHVVFNLNAIRMGTAVWFLSYGFISKFRLQNKSWFLWIILSVQIHFSIFFLALPVILFSFVQLRASWLFIFWLLSFVIHLNLASLSGYLPGFHCRSRCVKFYSFDYAT